MKFIDLFAGIGGFHKALTELGHECVFASEIDPSLQELYQKNWKLKPKGDIRTIVENNIEIIPPHDILCAGFPCQPFSKAGKQEGMEDKERGTLFDIIVKILQYRKPKYFILENVPHIAKHDNEETWKHISKTLSKDYSIDHNFYSPHDFGIPQHRIRMFIVGSRNGLTHFNFNNIDKQKCDLINVRDFFNEEPSIVRKLSKENLVCIKLWQEFINSLPNNVEMPGFPIWSMEFGASYPYDDDFPFVMKERELGKYKGSFGISLKGLSKEKQLEHLPSYARVTEDFPEWKKKYISQNREFYHNNKKYIKDIVKKISKYTSQSWQKLEWRVSREKGSILNQIIQFRPSGIRVKKADFFPSLVCTSTQIPIIGWEKRYITREEGLKLQSLDGLELPKHDNAAFKALGNAVNAKIVKIIAKELIKEKVIHLNKLNVATIQEVQKNNDKFLDYIPIAS